MKHILYKLGMVTALALPLLFFSCEKRPAGTAAGQTLTLALRAGTYSDVIKSCLPAFEAENNVHCNLLALDEDDLRNRIVSSASNSEAPLDLCMVDGSWMADFTAHGVLTSLSQLGYSLDDDIIPATTTICYNNGDLYLAPYYGNVTVMLYNRLMLKEAGYSPDTVASIDDIITICQEAKKRHNLGFLYRGDTNNNLVVDFLPILRSFGGWVVDENNQPTINTPEFYRALDSYITLIRTGRAAKKQDLITAVANKSAAIAVGWPGWYTPERNSTMDYFALTGKADKNSPAYNANIYGIWTIGIPANSRHKEMAVRLLSHLMDAKLQKQTVAKGGVPCRYSSLQDKDVLAKFPQYAVICKALENGIYRPVIKSWPEFYTILGQELKAILDGSKSISEGMIAAQGSLEVLLQDEKK